MRLLALTSVFALSIAVAALGTLIHSYHMRGMEDDSLHVVVVRFLFLMVPALGIFSFIFFGWHRFGRWLHRYRFWIGAGLIALAVIFNVSGSSLDMWNTYNGGFPLQGTAFGAARSIRSDEWGVDTPFAFSQAYNGYGFFNWMIGDHATNMFIIKDAPVWNIAEIFRPFHWGYLLFGSSRGLAYYWSARLVVLFLAAYQFFLTLTNKDSRQEEHTGLAALGATLITFAPLVQWWYAVNSLPEMLIATFVATVAFDRWLGEHRFWQRLGWAALIFECAGMFALSLYPAWQIPVAYVLLACLIGIFVRHWGTMKVTWRDWLGLVALAIIFAVILGQALWLSRGTIALEEHTAYPGARRSVGGSVDPLYMFASAGTLLLPFHNGFVATMQGGQFGINLSEAALFVDLFPIGIICAIVAMILNRHANALDVALIVVSALLLVFEFCGVPLWLSKALFLTAVKSTRASAGSGLANIILLVRGGSEIGKRMKWWWAALVAVCYGIFAAVICAVGFTPFALKLQVICAIVAALIAFAAISNPSTYVNHVVAAVAMCAVAFSGLSVNPVQVGAAAISNQPVVAEVQSINKKKPGVWVTVGMLGDFEGNLLAANGVTALNATQVTPNFAVWKKLDPTGKWRTVYNRYAFVAVNIVDKPVADPFQLMQPDLFVLTVTPKQLKELGVTYVLSTGNLNDLSEGGECLVQIGHDVTGRTPYRLESCR